MADKQDASAIAAIPGFTKTVGLKPLRAEGGESELVLDLHAGHLNSGGIVHGGVLATLLDCAGGAAVFSVLPATQFAPTTTMSISYISAVSEGRLVARGTVQKRGRRMLYCEAAVYCDDKLLATAQLSFMVMERTERLTPDKAQK